MFEHGSTAPHSVSIDKVAISSVNHVIIVHKTDLKMLESVGQVSPKHLFTMEVTAVVETKENVFLFVPNLIGYGRIVLAIASFWFMPTSYQIAGSCYLLSGLLDAFDGPAARMFRQSTKFGAILDQLTDRCATMALQAVLCTFYPQWMFFFQMSMVIDISCHWLYTQSLVMKGHANQKFIDDSTNCVMHLYYHSKPIFFLMCAGKEVFYTSLYLLHFTRGPHDLFYYASIASCPIAIAKLGVALLQGYLGSIAIAGNDTEERTRHRNLMPDMKS